MKKIAINLFIFSVLGLPLVTLAQVNPTGLVPCGGGTLPTCTVNHLFILIANIVRFLLFAVAMPLCALAITYGGIQIAMYSTNPGAKEKGKGIVISAAIGLLIALASYLIVDTILTVFTSRTLDTLQTVL